MLRFIPLGGLGEVGMNCMAFQHGDDIIVVDCGVTFPHRELGVDVIHSDFTWLRERRDQVRALFITHGHEDHIGAVPYLLRELQPPIYGPPYALELIRQRLEEHTPRGVDLRPFEAQRPVRAGAFEVTPLRVHHSILDAFCLVIDTPAGTVVHSGDFKIELDPVDDQVFDESALRAVGERGVRLLLSDSTNVDVTRRHGSERAAADALLRLVREAPHRVVVGLFASNGFRLRALFEAARATDRRVCVLGRSLHRHLDVLRDLRLVEHIDRLLVSSDDARAIPRERLVVAATGAQGEPRAALGRLARGEHPALGLDQGDTVLLSSRIIPGREREVFDMVDRLERIGVRVRSRKTDPDVHASGHACEEEQRALIRLLRPASFIPIHGTFHHMHRHAAVARDESVEDVLVVDDGDVVGLTEDSMRIVERAPAGRVHVGAGRTITETMLRERALLAELGCATVAVPVYPDGRLAGRPRVTARGALQEERAEATLAEAGAFVYAELKRAERMARRDDAETSDAAAVATVVDRARRSLRRFFGRGRTRTPLVAAVAVEVE
ncbi:MAG: ribonuclease J [Myxococcales bacterium]|nr:ribonuclease J [Myxococcales bacterium]